MAPILLPSAPAATGSPQGKLPSLPTSSQTSFSLFQAIETVRLADRRFRGIRVEVRGDAVFLRGTVYRWEHLYELARSVSRLPGVRRVFFEEVQAESP
jgi:hypothetical protein